MLIRPLLFAAALAACTSTTDLTPDASRLIDPPPPIASISQDSTVCNPQRYACDPYNPASRWVCDTVCGTPSYCRDYTVIETAFCLTHPDYFLGPRLYCDALGNPTWPTNCVDGFAP